MSDDADPTDCDEYDYECPNCLDEGCGLCAVDEGPVSRESYMDEQLKVEVVPW